MRRLKFPVRLFHLSARPLADLFVMPRIPKTDNAMEGEELRTPRFCMADSLVGCVRALGYSDAGCVGTVLSAYEPENPGNLFESGSVYRPNRFEVPDSPVTGEVWVLSPFRLRLAGSVLITGFSDCFGKAGNRYSIKGDSMYVDDFELEFRGESGIPDIV